MKEQTPGGERTPALPHHIAIILDGNRRWARERGLPDNAGHHEGLWPNLNRTIDHCLLRGIRVLTVYEFSTENWRRTDKEVDYLMNLFQSYIEANMARMNELGILLAVIGDFKRLPQSLQDCLLEAQQLTALNSRMRLNLALSYGGRSELVRAINSALDSRPPWQRVDEDVITAHLDTAGVCDPDLVIRTGGEKRLSNFLLWQVAYSELYFCDTYWPDFSEADLDAALADFAERERRLGL